MDNLGDDLPSQQLSEAESELDKTLLVLIMEACKAGRPTLATELMLLFRRAHSTTNAWKIPKMLHMSGLEERFRRMADERTAEEEDESRAERARRLRRERRAEDRSRVEPTFYNFDDEDDRRVRGFRDAGPPPRQERPGLKPAVPVIEGSRFSRKAQLATEEESFGTEPMSTNTSSPPGEKRKRDEDSQSWDDDSSAKRRALAPPPLPSVFPAGTHEYALLTHPAQKQTLLPARLR
jgi:hypothetical protein